MEQMESKNYFHNAYTNFCSAPEKPAKLTETVIRSTLTEGYLISIKAPKVDEDYAAMWKKGVVKNGKLEGTGTLCKYQPLTNKP